MRGPSQAFLIVLTSIVLATSGCASKPKAAPPPPPKKLSLVHHVGGTHHRLLVRDGTWYQTFGSSLLIIEPRSAEVIRTIELAEPGQSGPAVDLILVEGDAPDQFSKLIAVLEHHELIELSLKEPRLPAVTRRISAATLGIQPRTLSIVSGNVYVSGRGGVVRLADGVKLMSTEDAIGRVAMSEHGLVASVGRRVHRLENNQYVGSATSLWPLPQGFGVPGGLAFAVQNENAALVGLMSPNVRELDANKATVAVPGTIHSIRVLHNVLWVVSDQGLRSYRFQDGALHPAVHADILGARDVGPIDANHIAVSGSFGRAVYRMESNEKGAGDTFINVHREPGHLPLASSDGRHILAGGPQGMWLYLVNSRVEQTDQTRERWPAPPQTAATVGSTAAIADDGFSVNIAMGERHWRYAEPDGSRLRCIAAIDGHYWLGHERGITVLKPDEGMNDALLTSTRKPPVPQPVAGRLRLEGPVRHIYPLLVGGGASFVSEYGGMGVAKFVQ